MMSQENDNGLTKLSGEPSYQGFSHTERNEVSDDKKQDDLISNSGEVKKDFTAGYGEIQKKDTANAVPTENHLGYETAGSSSCLRLLFRCAITRS
jgi:hypothetical protein